MVVWIADVGFEQEAAVVDQLVIRAANLGAAVTVRLPSRATAVSLRLRFAVQARSPGLRAAPRAHLRAARQSAVYQDRSRVGPFLLCLAVARGGEASSGPFLAAVKLEES